MLITKTEMKMRYSNKKEMKQLKTSKLTEKK